MEALPALIHDNVGDAPLTVSVKTLGVFGEANLLCCRSGPRHCGEPYRPHLSLTIRSLLGSHWTSWMQVGNFPSTDRQVADHGLIKVYVMA